VAGLAADRRLTGFLSWAKVATVSLPRIAVGPGDSSLVARAIAAGGGEQAGAGEKADGLVWLSQTDSDGLRAALAATGARWVQLSSAGIERTVAAGLVDDGRIWTCAKGSYAEPVAEHALMLALAGLRVLPQRVTARSWGEPFAATLYDAPVTILGGGGITAKLLDLLGPFRARATVVRRSAEPVPGAARTLPMDDLTAALSDARVLFLALALTPATEHVIGAAQFAAMRSDSWLVNVARGRHVDTDALVTALRDGQIAGAGLDVTDPEPLPDGHPLWELENCIITPHTADTPEMVKPLLARRITENVQRFAAGEPLVGVVDPTAGY
jgi:phosphoglycerate dehydrogenase-like enzyme